MTFSPSAQQRVGGFFHLDVLRGEALEGARAFASVGRYQAAPLVTGESRVSIGGRQAA
jgi:hypothetical protein